MAIRTFYSTNDGMTPGVEGRRNTSNCAVAIGADGDGRYGISVLGFGQDALALIDRGELILIRDAITKELAGSLHG